MDTVRKLCSDRESKKVKKTVIDKNPLVQDLIDAIADKKKKYVDKVNSLGNVWNRYCMFITERSSQLLESDFEELLLNTLGVILKADWLKQASGAVLTQLCVALTKLIKYLEKSKKHPVIRKQCSVLLSIVEKPWHHHVVLSKITSSNEEVPINDLLEFFRLENVKIIITRLETMLESKCEDIAVRLSKSFLQSYYNCDVFELDANQEEIDYVTDIYYFSLFKTKKITELTNEIKILELWEGLHLLKRYKHLDELDGGFGKQAGRNSKEARIWKFSRKVIEKIADALLANAVIHDDIVDDETILSDLISEWGLIHRPNEDEDALIMIDKLVLVAKSSKCIYPFCSFLIEHCQKLPIKNVVCNLIRAINQNMNEIEQYRVGNKNDLLKQTYDQLSQGFVLISKLFNDYINIRKECLLTVFSLTPSKESLEQLESFVEKMLHTTGDTRSNSILGIQRREDVNYNRDKSTTTIKNPDDGSNYDVDSSELGQCKPADLASVELKEVTPPYCIEVLSLDLDDNIKTDLNSILRYQRFHKLTWELEWNELKTNCVKYLEIFEQRGYGDVELKFLEIDYNQYKDIPINEEEYIGIEKGYEQFVVYSDANEIEFDNYEDSESETLKSRKRKKSPSSDDEKILKIKKRKKSHQEQRGTFYDDFSDDDELLQFIEYQASFASNNADCSQKKKKKIAGSVAEDKNGKKRDRPRSIDSQSENKPPDDISRDDSTERRKKIKGRPFNSEENRVSEDSDMLLVTERSLPKIRISLSKCDRDLKIVKTDEQKSEIIQVRNPKDKRPRPRSSALAVSAEEMKNRVSQSDNNNMTCEVRVQKTDLCGFSHVIETTEKKKLKLEKKVDLQEELEMVMNVIDCKRTNDSNSDSVDTKSTKELEHSEAGYQSELVSLSSRNSISVGNCRSSKTILSRTSFTIDNDQLIESRSTPKRMRGRPKGSKTKNLTENEIKDKKKDLKPLQKRIKHESVKAAFSANTPPIMSYSTESPIDSGSPTMNSYLHIKPSIKKSTTCSHSPVNTNFLPSVSRNTNDVYMLVRKSHNESSGIQEIDSSEPRSGLEITGQSALSYKGEASEQILEDFRSTSNVRDRSGNSNIDKLNSYRNAKCDNEYLGNEMFLSFPESDLTYNQNSIVPPKYQQFNNKNHCQYNFAGYQNEKSQYIEFPNAEPAFNSCSVEENTNMMEPNGDCRVFQSFDLQNDFIPQSHDVFLNNEEHISNLSDSRKLPLYSYSSNSSQNYNSDYTPNGSIASLHTSNHPMYANNSSFMNDRNFVHLDPVTRYREKFQVQYQNSNSVTRCKRYEIQTDVSETINLNDSFSSSECESEKSTYPSKTDPPYVVYYQNINNPVESLPVIIGSSSTNTTISIPEHDNVGDNNLSLSNYIMNFDSIVK